MKARGRIKAGGVIGDLMRMAMIDHKEDRRINDFTDDVDDVCWSSMVEGWSE